MGTVWLFWVWPQGSSSTEGRRVRERREIAQQVQRLCDEDLRQQKRSPAHQALRWSQTPDDQPWTQGNDPLRLPVGMQTSPTPGESVWRFFKKLKLIFQMTPSIPPGYLLKGFTSPQHGDARPSAFAVALDTIVIAEPA